MKACTPAFLALIAGLGLSLASGNVVADTKVPAGDGATAVKPEPAKAPMLMTESQMDKVVAGVTTKRTGNTPPGHTIVSTSPGGGSSGGQIIGGTSSCFFVTGSGKPSNKPCP